MPMSKPSPIMKNKNIAHFEPACKLVLSDWKHMIDAKLTDDCYSRRLSHLVSLRNLKNCTITLTCFELRINCSFDNIYLLIQDFELSQGMAMRREYSGSLQYLSKLPKIESRILKFRRAFNLNMPSFVDKNESSKRAARMNNLREKIEKQLANCQTGNNNNNKNSNQLNGNASDKMSHFSMGAPSLHSAQQSVLSTNENDDVDNENDIFDNFNINMEDLDELGIDGVFDLDYIESGGQPIENLSYKQKQEMIDVRILADIPEMELSEYESEEEEREDKNRTNENGNSANRNNNRNNNVNDNNSANEKEKQKEKGNETGNMNVNGNRIETNGITAKKKRRVQTKEKQKRKTNVRINLERKYDDSENENEKSANANKNEYEIATETETETESNDDDNEQNGDIRQRKRRQSTPKKKKTPLKAKIRTKTKGTVKAKAKTKKRIDENDDNGNNGNENDNQNEKNKNDDKNKKSKKKEILRKDNEYPGNSIDWLYHINRNKILSYEYIHWYEIRDDMSIKEKSRRINSRRQIDDTKARRIGDIAQYYHYHPSIANKNKNKKQRVLALPPQQQAQGQAQAQLQIQAAVQQQQGQVEVEQEAKEEQGGQQVGIQALTQPSSGDSWGSQMYQAADQTVERFHAEKQKQKQKEKQQQQNQQKQNKQDREQQGEMNDISMRVVGGRAAMIGNVNVNMNTNMNRNGIGNGNGNVNVNENNNIAVPVSVEAIDDEKDINRLSIGERVDRGEYIDASRLTNSERKKLNSKLVRDEIGGMLERGCMSIDYEKAMIVNQYFLNLKDVLRLRREEKKEKIRKERERKDRQEREKQNDKENDTVNKRNDNANKEQLNVHSLKFDPFKLLELLD